MNSRISHFWFRSLYVVTYKMRSCVHTLFRTLYVARFRTCAVSHFALYKWPALAAGAVLRGRQIVVSSLTTSLFTCYGA